jgi:hypothetical protein
VCKTPPLALPTLCLILRAVLPKLAHFNWSDNVTLLPEPPRLYQDLSALKTGSPQPFGTLQGHTQRQRALHCPFNPPAISYTQHCQSHQLHHHHSHFNHNSLNSPHVSYKPSQPHFDLDWESDPHLSDLSCSLRAFGWIRAH